MKERNSLSSYRFVAVMVAQFIIQSLLLPLALSIGHGDKQKGFEKVMLVFAIVGVICFIITFLTTRERVKPVVEQKIPISPRSQRSIEKQALDHYVVHDCPGFHYPCA